MRGIGLTTLGGARLRSMLSFLVRLDAIHRPPAREQVPCRLHVAIAEISSDFATGNRVSKPVLDTCKASRNKNTAARTVRPGCLKRVGNPSVPLPTPIARFDPVSTFAKAGGVVRPSQRWQTRPRITRIAKPRNLAIPRPVGLFQRSRPHCRP